MLPKILLFVISFTLVFGAKKLPPLTTREKAAVDKLRAAIGSKLTTPYMHSDNYLVKWVKAKRFNVLEATKALENALEWRKEVDADNIPFQKVPEDLTKNYPIDFSHRDREGNLVVLMPFGDWDIRRKAIRGKISELYNRTDWMEETAAQIEYNITGYPHGLGVMDLSGFSTKRSACVPCIPFFVTWALHHELYYPYNGYKILFINTPKIFDPVLHIMRRYMTPATQDALRVHGFDRTAWIKDLAETVDVDTLPYRYGGTLKKDNNQNQ